MKLANIALLAWLSIGAGSAGAAAAAEKTALCPVCRVTKGEAEEEAVKTVRTYAGVEYGFCSEKCAKEFMADPAAYVPPEFPRDAPDFTLTGLDGRQFSSESAKGGVVLLDFWATWCVPCRKSMPALQALHTKYGARGLTVLGVSIDENAEPKVRKFVASKKLTYPIAIDSAKEPAWRAFRVKAVPAAFLLDREGRIVAQWTGAPANVTELEEVLEKLLTAD